MKISALLIAFASVAVAAPLPTSNDEHALSARGFRSTMSGMNPFFSKNKANQVNNLHTAALDKKINVNLHNVEVQGTHAFNFGGIFGSTKKTAQAAEKSAAETKLANSAFTKAQEAKAKAAEALKRQDSARKAREAALAPTGVRDAFSKAGTAVSKTAKAGRANADANAAAAQARSELNKARQAMGETKAALNA